MQKGINLDYIYFYLCSLYRESCPLLAESLERRVTSAETSPVCFRHQNSLEMLSPLTPPTPPTSCLQTPAPSTGCLWGSYSQEISLRDTLGQVFCFCWNWAPRNWRVQHFPIFASACNVLTIHFSPKDTAFGLCASFTFLWRLPTEVAITRLVCHTDNCSLGINFPQRAPDFHFYSNNRNT